MNVVGRQAKVFLVYQMHKTTLRLVKGHLPLMCFPTDRARKYLRAAADSPNLAL